MTSVFIEDQSLKVIFEGKYIFILIFLFVLFFQLKSLFWQILMKTCSFVEIIQEYHALPQIEFDLISSESSFHLKFRPIQQLTNTCDCDFQFCCFGNKNSWGSCQTYLQTYFIRSFYLQLIFIVEKLYHSSVFFKDFCPLRLSLFFSITDLIVVRSFSFILRINYFLLWRRMSLLIATFFIKSPSDP